MSIHFFKSNFKSPVQNLTQGNIYQQLMHLAVPLIIGNILQQFYNTIDAFVVGHYAGTEEFAAIGIAGTVMNLFLFILVGACTGLSVLFARYYGVKNDAMLHRQHFTALSLGIVFSICLGILGLLGMHGILTLIQTPTELMQYTSIYLRWIFISLPAAFLYNLYAAALRASGDTKAALYILAAAIFSNLILDILFVACLKQGISGAAMATALTQCISAFCCIVYMLRCRKELIFEKKDCIFDRALILTTVKCSFATAVHQASLYIGKMLVQGVVNTAGTDIISAYTAATRIEGFANSFGDSGSAATSVLVSQNYGAHQPKRVQKIFWCSLRITACLGLICALALFAGAPLTIGLLLGSNEGIAFSGAVHYLRLIAAFYVFCFTGGTFTGFYNGTGKVFITLTGSVGQITIRVILSWLTFSKIQLNAVALATGIGWIATNVFWAIYKIWQNHKKRFNCKQ